MLSGMIEALGFGWEKLFLCVVYMSMHTYVCASKGEGENIRKRDGER